MTKPLNPKEFIISTFEKVAPEKEPQINEVFDYEVNEFEIDIVTIWSKFDADGEMFEMSVKHKTVFEILKGLFFIEDFEFIGKDRVLIHDEDGEHSANIGDFLRDQVGEFINDFIPAALKLSNGNEVEREGIWVWEAKCIDDLQEVEL